MTLAYIGPWSSETNLKAAKAFVKALSDSGEIYDKVKELEPQSVEEAYSFARRFEVQKLAESMASVQIEEPPDLEAGTKKRGVRQKGSRQKKRKAEEPLPELGVAQVVVEDAEESSRREKLRTLLNMSIKLHCRNLLVLTSVDLPCWRLWILCWKRRTRYVMLRTLRNWKRHPSPRERRRLGCP